jgi:hypothetical protein
MLEIKFKQLLKNIFVNSALHERSLYIISFIINLRNFVKITLQQNHLQKEISLSYCKNQQQKLLLQKKLLGELNKFTILN